MYPFKNKICRLHVLFNCMYADAFVFIQGKIWALRPNCVWGKCFVVLEVSKIFLKNNKKKKKSHAKLVLPVWHTEPTIKSSLWSSSLLLLSSLVCLRAGRPAGGPRNVYSVMSEQQLLISVLMQRYPTPPEHLHVKMSVIKVWVWVMKTNLREWSNCLPAVHYSEIKPPFNKRQVRGK